jgi:glycosyltransferase involved in cell wall biosynthesis
VDDGSTDRSVDIVRSFGERVELVLQNHGGAPKARNRGVEEASGEFIHFLDADDILFPYCIKRKMEAASSEKADVVYSGSFFFNSEANAGTYESHAPSRNDRPGLVAHIIRNSLVTTTLLCRRELLINLRGFNEELMNGQEHDLLLRLALIGAKFTYVPKALSCNRTNHNLNSITSVTQGNPDRLEKLFWHFEGMLKETELWVPRVRAALSLRFHMVGVEYMALDKHGEAITMFEKAKRVAPKYILGLPLSRRLLVPMVGEYMAEKLIRRIREKLGGLKSAASFRRKSGMHMEQ